ncbi:TIGR03862 family flavoprotein [Azoarcus sp. L1K30]|uniref:TIGR03862 family flavoprotein n=1 Tax=Azoarcus sp. L1K30 TaxID=2820277 RepID=UPI001B82EC3F|nr:TIGR03862 family flavoprotein [Azoarcus sp. L1K30]MBR0566753.1 TIGR03862 family flavoprotein [Azoarcus sp. L1K30]
MKRTAARHVAVIGGGPAGLMAAERVSAQGIDVTVFDAMPSVGRKFLLAGRGGLNLTHSEPLDAFLTRYGTRAAELAPMIEAFGPAALRDWAASLGIDTFVGSSGRVFPTEMKAAPLLRAWLARLRSQGVKFAVRHRWQGWVDTAPTQILRFSTREGERYAEADAVILALGGGSWAKLGSDGAWVDLLRARGVDIADLRPANCGFDVSTDFATDTANANKGWSTHFLERFAGAPIKSVAARCTDPHGHEHTRSGECMISPTGIEGGLIYALSAPLRDSLHASGKATLHLDLAPGRSLERLVADLSRPRGSRSLASHLQGQAGIKGVKAGLLRECLPAAALNDPAQLATAIKALPLRLIAPRPLDEAISSAGGVRFEDTLDGTMLRALPGVFCAGEMLDWEAPTGGYLLTACLASGHAAGLRTIDWLNTH